MRRVVPGRAVHMDADTLRPLGLGRRSPALNPRRCRASRQCVEYTVGAMEHSEATSRKARLCNRAEIIRFRRRYLIIAGQ